MPRELNPQLFADRAEATTSPSTDPTTKSHAGAIKASGETPVQDIINTKLIEEIQWMRKKIRDLEGQVSTVSGRLNSFVESSLKGQKQMQSAHRNLESVMKNNFQDFSGKLSKLGAKVTDFRIGESKTQELIDRHNQLVQNFDSRLQQMHKFVSNQEMKLLNYQSTLQRFQQKMDRP